MEKINHYKTLDDKEKGMLHAALINFIRDFYVSNDYKKHGRNWKYIEENSVTFITDLYLKECVVSAKLEENRKMKMLIIDCINVENVKFKFCILLKELEKYYKDGELKTTSLGKKNSNSRLPYI
jgi:hypothetical protein